MSATGTPMDLPVSRDLAIHELGHAIFGAIEMPRAVVAIIEHDEDGARVTFWESNRRIPTREVPHGTVAAGPAFTVALDSRLEALPLTNRLLLGCEAVRMASDFIETPKCDLAEWQRRGLSDAFLTGYVHQLGLVAHWLGRCGVIEALADEVVQIAAMGQPTFIDLAAVRDAFSGTAGLSAASNLASAIREHPDKLLALRGALVAVEALKAAPDFTGAILRPGGLLPWVIDGRQAVLGNPRRWVH